LDGDGLFGNIERLASFVGDVAVVLKVGPNHPEELSDVITGCTN
jgi:UDP-N-acetylmuramyl pentapeptide synthase